MVLVVLALLAQRMATRGRSYAVLSGRTRPARPVALRGWRSALALAGLSVFFLLALGVPALGTVSASLMGNFGTLDAHNFTVRAYQQVFQRSDLLAPVLLSVRLALITATLALVGGALIARLLARRGGSTRGKAANLLDLLMLGAVALPAIVLGAGYIFSYNLPAVTGLGIQLYGTITLLVIGLLAGAVPQASRLLMGSFAQVQDSLLAAARVHGAGAARAWRSTMLPLLSGSLLWTWLLTFGDRLLELPLAAMLYPPGQEPLSVSVTTLINGYDFAGGTATLVVACAGILVVIGVALALFRLLAPAGWRRLEQR